MKSLLMKCAMLLVMCIVSLLCSESYAQCRGCRGGCNVSAYESYGDESDDGEYRGIFGGRVRQRFANWRENRAKPVVRLVKWICGR